MKRIEAIIRPDRVSDVCAALEGIGQRGITISAVEERGERPEWVHHVRSASYNDSSRAGSRVEVLAKDEDAVRIISTIRNAAATGGNILIHDLADVIAI